MSQQPYEPHPKYKFNYAPEPRALGVAYRGGLVDEWDLVILFTLYDCGSATRLLAVGKPQASLTLATLSSWTRWQWSEDALSKRLRRLRDNGWLSWTIVKRNRYRFVLPYIEDEIPFLPSESGPRATGVTRPSSKPPKTRKRSEETTTADSEWSEIEWPGIAPSGPSSTSNGPSSKPATNASTEPKTEDETKHPVRVAHTSQYNHKPSITTDLLKGQVWEDPAREYNQRGNKGTIVNPPRTGSSFPGFVSPSAQTQLATYKMRIERGDTLTEEERADLLKIQSGVQLTLEEGDT